MSAKQLGERVEFDALRKKRQRTQRIKRLLGLCGVVLGIGLLILLNYALVDLGATSTRVSDLLQSFGGNGFPVELPGGVIRDVKHSGDSLIILNDTNLYVYNANGKMINSVQKMSDNTVLLAGETRLLTFDPRTKRYAVHSRTQTLAENTPPYAMITAAINDKGDYAIVTEAKHFASEVTVYNNQRQEIYLCQFADNQVSSIALSPKGLMMAAGSISAKDGVIESYLEIYRFSSKNLAASASFPDNLILDLHFLDDNQIAVLTDRQYCILNVSGDVVSSYSFAGRELRACERRGKNALLLLENPEARTRDLVLLDGSCQETATLSLTGGALDLALGGKNIYVLTENSIDTYDLTLTLVEQDKIRQVSNIHLVGDRLFYMTREEIKVLGQANDEKPSESEEDIVWEPKALPDPVEEELPEGEEEDTEQASPEPSVRILDDESAEEASSGDGEQEVD